MSGFAKETDLCADFIACLPNGWTAYPETGGFDILLVRDEDGFQVGVEAKLRLNGKVISQAIEGGSWWSVDGPQPDCRAVLVPSNAKGGLEAVCAALGVTVLKMRVDIVRENGEIVWSCGKRDHGIVKVAAGHGTQPFSPQLPTSGYGDYSDSWFERCPNKRLELPEWVPDVIAGDKAPVALTVWKIKAIKLRILLDRRGYLTRRDFKHFQISMSRWVEPYRPWLVRDGKGGGVAGPHLPDFKAQHPVNFDEIAAEYENWRPGDDSSQPGLFRGAEA